MDLVIRGGTVVDGTGAPPRTGRRRHRRAIASSRSARSTAARRREIDADGPARHARASSTSTPTSTARRRGTRCWRRRRCTASPPSPWATAASASRPARTDRHDWLIGLLEGVEDIPGTALAEGLTWGWESFPEYLDVLDAHAAHRRRRRARARTPRCAPTSWASAAPTTCEHPDRRRARRRWRGSSARRSPPARSASPPRAPRSTAPSDGANIGTLTAGEAELLAIAGALAEHGAGRHPADLRLLPDHRRRVRRGRARR